MDVIDDDSHINHYLDILVTCVCVLDGIVSLLIVTLHKKFFQKSNFPGISCNQYNCVIYIVAQCENIGID